MEILVANINDLEEILAIQKKAFIQEAAIYQLCSIAPVQQSLDEIIDRSALHNDIEAVIMEKTPQPPKRGAGNK